MSDTTVTPQQQAELDKQREVMSEFNEKKGSYPSAWQDAYNQCKADEEFVIQGLQLTPQMAKQYGFGKNFKMPNLLKSYINNQANQTLENDYRAVVSPNGGGADIGKARLREQVLRGIQRVGGAPEVYNYARRGQLAGGLHYSKVVVDYADARGLEQEYTFEDIQDTYSVYPDPYVQKATFKDMGDFLIREDVPKGKWKEKTGRDWNNGSEKTHAIWFYWRKVKSFSDKEYFNIEDGKGILESELPPGADGSPDLTMVKKAEDGTPYSRDVTKHQWEWYIIDDKGDSVYNSGEWLGSCSPLVACSGEKIVQKNEQGVKVFYQSLAHDAKEPQMVYTILENIILLRLAKSPYSHWKIAWESIVLKQLEEYRKNAVIGDNDILYKAFTEDGQKQIPAPEEIEPKVLDAILLELQQVQIQKIERILGIYDAALGQKTNEKSGVAIKERAKMSNLANYHLEFNFLEYVQQLGYVVMESMPHYLTVRQVVPMLDDEDKIVMEEINRDGLSFEPDERYRMVIEVLPDSDTNREAEADMLMHMADSQNLGPVMMQTPGVAAKVVKAQRGRYAQEIGKMMEGAASDPEKQQMAQQLDELQKNLQKTQQDFEALQKSRSLEEMKEANRHEEKMAELAQKVAANADKTEVDAFNANTKREQVNAVPQIPNSLPVEA